MREMNDISCNLKRKIKINNKMGQCIIHHFVRRCVKKFYIYKRDVKIHHLREKRERNFSEKKKLHRRKI